MNPGVIPGREPTDPASGRPDDRLRERIRNQDSPLRNCASGNEGSSDDVRRDLVFDERDAVAQLQL
ncbi:MAG TPA: hypothetical protein VD863_11890, partial [Bradyrhizobium sp.]|nr:hypothetical protein [Bradyrhizobium sp.]